MMNDNLTRRRVLAGAAGTFGMLSVGTATAQETSQHIVGIDPSTAQSSTTAQAAQNAVTAQANAVRHVLDFGGRGTVVAGRFSSQALDALRQRSDVRYVEPDATGQALAQTLPWGVNRIDADVVQANGTTGNGADIAILDTGIDSDHPDLQANLGEGTSYVRCTESYDVTCYQSWDDDGGHGTRCAGIVGAVNNTEGVVGVAPESTLHAVKVLNGTGAGYYSDFIAGIKWTADQGYDVGSLSFGGSADSQGLADACQYAYDRGVLLVAAAGLGAFCSNCVRYPAKYPTVVAVGATTKDDRLASFSATGPEIELAAPGREIHTTSIGGYDVTYGTSMACAHVAGTAGLLMANGYTNTEARQTLQETAEDIGLSGTAQGYGLVDTEAAVQDLFQLPRTIEIRGTGTRADYTFSVDGTLQPGSGLSGEDSIRGQTATGAVGDGTDQYQFTGSVTDFGFDSGSANVFVGDSPDTLVQVDPETFFLNNRLVILGQGQAANYDVTTSSRLAGGPGLTGEDEIVSSTRSGSRASGAVRGGRDEYLFNGSITGFGADAPVRVFVGPADGTVGEQPAGSFALPNTLEITGQGTRADYSFRATGELKGESLTSEDSITGSSATGAVRGGTDSYQFSGRVRDFTVSGPVTVRLNGEVVDPATL